MSDFNRKQMTAIFLKLHRQKRIPKFYAYHMRDMMGLQLNLKVLLLKLLNLKISIWLKLNMTKLRFSDLTYNNRAHPIKRKDQ